MKFFKHGAGEIHGHREGAHLLGLRAKGHRNHEGTLLKKGALNEVEWEAMRRHPEAGAALARGAVILEAAAPIIAAHHERWDGRGYSAGLEGEAIPMGARIVAVDDIYDALTTSPPYKRAFSHAETVACLRDQSGKALDARVVSAFDRIPFSQLSDAAKAHGIRIAESGDTAALTPDGPSGT